MDEPKETFDQERSKMLDVLLGSMSCVISSALKPFESTFILVTATNIGNDKLLPGLVSPIDKDRAIVLLKKVVSDLEIAKEQEYSDGKFKTEKN